MVRAGSHHGGRATLPARPSAAGRQRTTVGGVRRANPPRRPVRAHHRLPPCRREDGVGVDRRSTVRCTAASARGSSRGSNAMPAAPVEYLLLDLRPELPDDDASWAAAFSFLAWGLSGNWDTELLRTWIRERAGDDAVRRIAAPVPTRRRRRRSTRRRRPRRDLRRAPPRARAGLQRLGRCGIADDDGQSRCWRTTRTCWPSSPVRGWNCTCRRPATAPAAWRSRSRPASCWGPPRITRGASRTSPATSRTSTSSTSATTAPPPPTGTRGSRSRSTARGSPSAGSEPHALEVREISSRSAARHVRERSRWIPSTSSSPPSPYTPCAGRAPTAPGSGRRWCWKRPEPRTSPRSAPRSSSSSARVRTSSTPTSTGTIGYACTGRFPVRRAGDGTAPVAGMDGRARVGRGHPAPGAPVVAEPRPRLPRHREQPDPRRRLPASDRSRLPRAVPGAADRRVPVRLERTRRLEHDGHPERHRLAPGAADAATLVGLLGRLEAPTEDERTALDILGSWDGDMAAASRRGSGLQRVVPPHRAAVPGAAAGRGSVPPLPRVA